MLIVITGEIGIGKSTVSRQVVTILKNQGFRCAGFLTYKGTDRSIIIESIASGEVMPFASKSINYGGPQIPAYYFNPAAIEFGLKTLAGHTSSLIAVIDELGILEIQGEGFTPLVADILSGRLTNTISVIRQNLLPQYMEKFKVRPIVFEVKLSNRDSIPVEIARTAMESFEKTVKISFSGESRTKEISFQEARRFVEESYTDPIGGLVANALTGETITRLTPDVDEINILQMLGGG